MRRETNHSYRFKSFRLDVEDRRLFRDDIPVPLEPKIFDVLALLVENSGHLVEKNELLRAVWADSFVEETNIARAVYTLRKTLGDDGNGNKFIETVAKKGYRFVAEVEEIRKLSEIPAQQNPAEKQPTNSLSLPFSVVNGKKALESTDSDSSKASASENAKTSVKLTRRRKGLLRGLKFLSWGIGVGFVFLIFMQSFRILSILLFQYENKFFSDSSKLLPDLIGNLLILILIPIGLGFFTGIGLILFGGLRIIFALFEKEDLKFKSSSTERVMVLVIVSIILAVAIPNIISSYREADRIWQLQKKLKDNKKSIAVLPVKPVNTANRDELYEIGIADSLIHRLSAAKNLIVRPLSATRHYSDLAQDPLAAGREQKTDYVLASNYQLADGRIRITAQLFNVATGQIEETYKSEKDASRVFAAQDTIAGELGNLLFARFAAAPNKTVANRGTAHREAYLLYLQGRNLTAKRNQADAQKAIEYFEQALRLDPNYALAFAGMAYAYTGSGTLERGPLIQREVYEKAREAINKAAELDADLADVYAVRGKLKLYEWDFAGAENDLKKAIELEPNNDLGHRVYAMWLSHHGRFDESLAEIEIALEIDPNSLEYQRERGRFLYFARRYDEAIAHLERVLEIDENFGTAFHWLILAYEMKGDYAGAFKWIIKDQKRRNPESVEVFQEAYETGGWEVFRRKLLEFFKLDERTSGNFYRIAREHALLGEKEQAFEYLNKAFEKRQTSMTMLKVEPAFDNLRDDPRFDELLGRVGFK